MAPEFISQSTAGVLAVCLIAGLILIPGAAGAKVWNVSCLGGEGVCTSLLDIHDLREGDTIRIWGEDGHRYEGGFTVNRDNVVIKRWEGSPARPLITNTSHTAPAITVRASGVSLEDLDISDNTYGGNGAGVYARGRDGHNPFKGFNVRDCVFTGNTVTGKNSRGGAMCLEHVKNSRINGTTFVGNRAGEGGGAYLVDSNNMSLSEVTFENNTAIRGGGARLFDSSPIYLSKGTFENNRAERGGGAHFEISLDSVLTDTTFVGNQADLKGGGAFLSCIDGSSLINMTFEDNRACEGGGAYFDYSDYANLIDTTFVGNQAGQGGGVRFEDSFNLVIKNCLFENDNNLFAKDSDAKTLNEDPPIPGTNIAGGPYLGGNVWLRDPAQNISEWGSDADFDGLCDQNLTFGDFGTDEYPLIYGGTVEVTSAPDGACVCVDGVRTNRTTDAPLYLPVGMHILSLQKDGYLSGTAEVNVTPGCSQSVEIPLTEITHPMIWNVSNVAGAGNYTNVSLIPEIGEGDTIRIWGVDGHRYEGGFLINASGVSVERWGGSPARPLITNTSHAAPAITVTASGVSLEGLDISDNTYYGNAAGVYAEGEYGNPLKGFNVRDCVFTGNTAYGALSAGALCLEYVDNSRINGTTFVGNRAGDTGGGASFMDSDNASLSEVTFENNRADEGGGASFMDSDNANLSEVTFENNTAGSRGGGACFWDLYDASLSEVTFENNTANVGGGAHFDVCFDLVLTDTTFVGNQADLKGGGAFLSSIHRSSLINMTFESNQAGEGGGAYFWASHNAVIKNCLFENENNLFFADNSSADALNEPAPIPGTNIAGGPYLGGNVWLRDPAQNISEWGPDANFDGLCDQNLTFGDFGTDEYPLIYGGGTVDVNSTPCGACVCVDGVRTNCLTDAPLYLPVGEFNITVRLDGYVTPPEKVVSVTSGNTTGVSFGPLVRATGSLRVESVPEGAHIVLDGVDIGILTDSTLPDLLTGEHNVTVRLDDYVTPPEEVVTITAGNLTTVSFDLVRATGSLRVESVPEGAHIVLDGVDIGILTDSTLPDLLTGEHNVTVRLDDYVTPPEEVVTITAGNLTTVSFDLVHESGSLRVESVPDGARIILDGVDTGSLTNSVLPDLLTGQYNVTVRLRGYVTPPEQVVMVTADNLTTLSLDLVHESGSLSVSSVPTGAQIILDGSDTGILTNSTFPDLLTGEHYVTVSLRGYVTPPEEVVRVVAGKTTAVSFDLVRDTGSLSVSSVPKGAHIFVDGSDTGRLTNSTISDLLTGEHNVTVRLDGYVTPPEEVVTVLAGGTTAVSFDLVHESGSLLVESVPPGAHIIVDGSDTGLLTNSTLSDLLTGDHYVTVRLDGYVTPPEQVVSVTPDNTATVSFSPEPVAESGSLLVGSVPPGAHIILDGTDTGLLTNSTLPDLPTGQYNVTVRLDGYVTPPEQVVSVTPDNSATVSFSLEPVAESGSLRVESVPPGAHIILDGTDTGLLTNSTLPDLPTGQHNVTVRLDGYVTPPEQVVSVTPGNTATVSFSPEPVPTPTPTPRHHTSGGGGGGRSGLSSGTVKNLPESGYFLFTVHNSAFSEINITTRQSITELLITVGRKALPSGIEPPAGVLYEYDEFLLYHTTDEMIREQILNFSVSKTWLSEQGLVPGDVILYSLHDGKWQAVLITLIREDSGNYYFTARSQGFSSFAICGVPGTELTATPTFATGAEIRTYATAETTTTPTTTQQSPIGSVTIILAVAGFSLLLRRR